MILYFGVKVVASFENRWVWWGNSFFGSEGRGLMEGDV